MKHQHQKQLCELDETLSVFVIGNSTNASAVGDETFEPQTISRFHHFGRVAVGENSACQNQVIENNIDDQIRKTLDSAVLNVENGLMMRF